MKKPIVAHLTTGHEPMDIRVYRKECSSLASNGYKVFLIVPSTTELVTKNGVSIFPISITNNRLVRIAISPFWALRKSLSTKAEIFHLHDPDLIIVGLFLKLIGKKVIFDSHEDFLMEMATKTWIAKPLRKIFGKLYGVLEKFAFKKFDALIGVNDILENRFQSLNKRSVAIKNYPIINRKILPTSTKNSKFLWFGMLSPIRSSEQLNAAFSLRPNFELDVIGNVFDFTPTSDNINLLGAFEHDTASEMASTYLAGLVTYLPEPNSINSLPNKLFEYMSLGLPVICSNFESWKKIIEDDDCGIVVNPNSPADIASALTWIWENPKEAAKMGERGRKAVVSKYTWATEEAKLLSLYRELTSGD